MFQLFLPGLVHNSAPVRLSLLEHHLVLPLRDIDRVNPPPGLTAEAAAVAPRRRALDLGHVDVPAHVELERGLGAQHLEMDARLGVVGGEVEAQGLAAGVDGDGARVQVGEEAVVDVGLRLAKGEGLVGVDDGELGGAAGGDVVGVDGEVLVGWEGDDGAGVSLIAGEVEVRVVCHHDGSFICAIDQLGLVLHSQDESFLSVIVLSARRIHNLDLQGPREALITILTNQRKLNALTTLEPLDAGNLSKANGLGSVPDPLAPAHLSSVECVGTIVGEQRIGLAVDVVELGSGNAVCDAADGLAKVRGVVFGVVFLFGETLDDVDTADVEGLDDGSEREKGEGGVSHFWMFPSLLQDE